MSIAAAHASRFYEQVAQDQAVFTVQRDGNFIVLKIRDVEVIPFWSSRTRVQEVMAAHPKYQAYDIAESTLEAFLHETLPMLEEEHIHVGVNWSGVNLSGYNVPVQQVAANVQYWLDKASSAG